MPSIFAWLIQHQLDRAEICLLYIKSLHNTAIGCWEIVCLLVGCLTSQQQASVSQGRICSDNFTCCHTEIEVADPTFYLTQSLYADTGPTSPSADPITPGAWQGSHWSANFEVIGMTRPRKKSRRKRDSNPGPSALEADALTTRPTRRLLGDTWSWSEPLAPSLSLMLLVSSPVLPSGAQ